MGTPSPKNEILDYYFRAIFFVFFVSFRSKKMTTDMNRWKGKVAFVTGANGGIGMAITNRLLNLGLAVVAIDKQTDHLLVSTNRI